jgi:hypothetical protein
LQLVVEFLDFEQVEDALGFEDAVLLEEEVGEEAVAVGDGVGEGLLQVRVESAQVAAYGFADIDAGFEEGDGEFGLGLAVEESADVAEEDSFFGTGTEFVKEGDGLTILL